MSGKYSLSELCEDTATGLHSLWVYLNLD